LDVTERVEGRANLLVVEDDPVLGPIIVQMLEKGGYRATLASDGDSAIVAVKSAHYDLAIADIVLGTRDGNEVAEALTAIQPQLKVILMSGYGAPRYGLGPQDPMLFKPFEASELLERVERTLVD
jgi:DNA-binding response OmpR family regulator